MELKKGFSLIELMVVIAIIALLAAVALPSYKNYAISARVSSLVPFMDTMIQKAITFANINGYFPNAGQLISNHNTTSTSISTASPSGVQGFYYFEAYDISTILNAASPPCGRAGIINFALNAASFGFPSGHITLSCVMANKNSIVETKCFYVYNSDRSSYLTADGLFIASSSTAATSKLVPGWSNAKGVAANTVASFVMNSTCM